MRLGGHVFRAHHPRWAHRPDSGEGAALHGGRFNPIGVSALYTSLAPETAWLEAQQGFAFKPQPMTLCAYEVDCEDMLDLTSASEMTRLGLGPADLACAWEALARAGQEPPTWTLARRLVAARTAGILVPSFAMGAGARDINAVFWRWTAAVPHRVAVVDTFGRLPRDDASWR